MAINIHRLIRNAINRVHPDTSATLYRSVGQVVATGGVVKAIYAAGVPIKAQAQTESAKGLYHADKVGQEETVKKFYLYSDASLKQKVAGIVRPLSRNGDMIQIDDGTWWLVIAVTEDFTRSGWVCVRAEMQTNAPDFSASEWFK